MATLREIIRLVDPQQEIKRAVGSQPRRQEYVDDSGLSYAPYGPYYEVLKNDSVVGHNITIGLNPGFTLKDMALELYNAIKNGEFQAYQNLYLMLEPMPAKHTSDLDYMASETTEKIDEIIRRLDAVDKMGSVNVYNDRKFDMNWIHLATGYEKRNEFRMDVYFVMIESNGPARGIISISTQTKTGHLTPFVDGTLENDMLTLRNEQGIEVVRRPIVAKFI